MSHLDHRTLIDRGRKSGLNTSELYRALTGRQPPAGEVPNGSCDSNGFTPSVDAQGHTVYKPQDSPGAR